MRIGRKCLLTVVLALLAAAPAPALAAEHRVPGEKLDSGVGELPPYEQWAAHPDLARLLPTGPARRHAVLGEKIDSGLGELPPYREWAPPLRRASADTRTDDRVRGQDR